MLKNIKKTLSGFKTKIIDNITVVLAIPIVAIVKLRKLVVDEIEFQKLIKRMEANYEKN